MTIISCPKHQIEFEALDGCPQCIAERQAAEMGREAAERLIEQNPKVARQLAEEAIAGKEVPPFIVKVRYYSETTGETSNREYTYFSIDPLKVGDVVQVPMRDTVAKAKVTAVNIPESEIAAFRAQVKTIPAGSKLTDQTQAVTIGGKIEDTGTALQPPLVSTEEPIFEEAEPEQLQARLTLSEGVSEETKEAAAVLEDITGGQIQVVQPEKPVTLTKVDGETESFETVQAAIEQGGEGSTITVEGTADTKPPALVTLETQVGRPFSGLFQLYQEAASLLRVAKARTITTNEDLKPATDDLAIIAVCKKAMFSRKDEIVGPIKARLDTINQAFADLMFPVLEADRLTRAQVSTFDNEQRRKAAEAKRIEDEKLKLAKEEAALTGTGEITVPLGTAQAPPPVPEHTRTDLGTLGGRANWKARVLDFKLLDDQWKIANQSLLDSHARTTKGERPIPGVEFYDDRVVTMRTR